MLDRERMPRYPRPDSANEYDLINRLISNNQTINKAHTAPTNAPSCDMRFPSLAMMYSPMQEFDDLYDPDDGLCRGTIFKKLDLPFCGRSLMNS